MQVPRCLIPRYTPLTKASIHVLRCYQLGSIGDENQGQESDLRWDARLPERRAMLNQFPYQIIFLGAALLLG